MESESIEQATFFLLFERDVIHLHAFWFFVEEIPLSNKSDCFIYFLEAPFT